MLIVGSGARAGERLTFEDELVLGRDGDVSGLDDAKLSRRHAVVRRRPDGSLEVEDLGSTNGTFVNDERIAGRRTLAPGDLVRVGDTTLEVERRVAEDSEDAIPTDQLPQPLHQVGSPTALHVQPVAPAGAVLHAGRRLPIPPGGLTVGRQPDNDVVVESELASRNHAKLALAGGRYFVADLGSRNGTYLNGERLLGEARWLSPGDAVTVAGETLRFLTGEETRVGAEVVLEPSFKAIRFEGRPLTIGRDPANDIPLEAPTISRFHAEIAPVNGAVEIRDLGSQNGTRLDGRAVAQAPLRAGSEIGIGPFRLVFDGSSFLQRDDRGALRLDAFDLSVAVKEKLILDRVSLSIQPGEFVAVIGESGSGKTTLLKVLAGVSRPTHGAVLLNGESIGTRLADVGYLPQDEIVHPRLTVLESLRYSARLRLPTDASAREVEDAAARAIRDTGLEQHAGTRIGSLSGGQRKRVGLATELLSSPGLLFLDEPTTGLDPGLETRMMELFRSLAAVGSHAVFVVTHATRNLELVDRLCVMGRGGNPCFVGKPEDAKEFFGTSSYDDIYGRLDVEPAEEWRRRFELTAPPAPPRLETSEPARTRARAASSAPAVRMLQGRVLTQRYLKTFVRDGRNLLLLLLQAPLIASAIALLFEPDVFAPVPDGSPSSAAQLLFTLVVTMAFVGTISGAREIIKERAILTREQAVGVRSDAYLASKLAVLAPLVAVQAALLAIVVFRLRPLYVDDGAYLSVFILLALTGLAAVSMGLAISALVRTEEQAMALIPVAMILQLLFGGAIVTVANMGALVAPFSALVFSRWSFAGIGAVVDMNGRIESDPVFSANNPYGLGFFDVRLGVTVLILLGFTAAFVAMAGVLLRRRHE